ncbi:MAG: hypothetical protein RLZZ490_2125 [Cyanobacteriota bacterium]
MAVVDYLRISLIDRCNYRCLYCLPSGLTPDYFARPELLNTTELLGLLREVFIPLGFTKFRLTGGEPLLRPDLVEIVTAIANFPETQDLALTTNGFDLERLAKPLYEAGLRRINISFDSLDPETFGQMVGQPGTKRWQQTWAGIQAAHAVGFDPLKLNVVVIPGINDQEVEALAALTLTRRWQVRFIEFMPIGNQTLFDQKAWIPSAELRHRIQQKMGLEPLQNPLIPGNGPADIFQIPGALGTVGFISQMSECFCDRCNRVRLSADGWLRPCLLNETDQLDLKTPWRSSKDPETLKQKVAELLGKKPEINFKGRDTGNETGHYRRTMSQIGG